MTVSIPQSSKIAHKDGDVLPSQNTLILGLSDQVINMLVCAYDWVIKSIEGRLISVGAKIMDLEIQGQKLCIFRNKR